MKIKKICEQCGKEFETYGKRRKACSKECGYVLMAKKRKNGIWKNCLFCNEKYYVPRNRKKSKFCSKKCANKGIDYKPNRKSFKKGNIPWNKNLTIFEDMRIEKLSQKARKTLKRKYKSGEIKSWNKGKKMSLKTRKKQSMAKKIYIQSHPEYLMRIGNVGKFNLLRSDIQAKCHSEESMKKVAEKNKINTKRYFQSQKNREKQSERIKKSWLREDLLPNRMRHLYYLETGISKNQLTNLDEKIIESKTLIHKIRRSINEQNR